MLLELDREFNFWSCECDQDQDNHSNGPIRGPETWNSITVQDSYWDRDGTMSLQRLRRGWESCYALDDMQWTVHSQLRSQNSSDSGRV